MGAQPGCRVLVALLRIGNKVDHRRLSEEFLRALYRPLRTYADLLALATDRKKPRRRVIDCSETTPPDPPFARGGKIIVRSLLSVRHHSRRP